ncbi:uncharacterized protein LOC105422891 [Pogonomyrmex barbatus]|uniref:Uncharacterized protein LOC105422891 n=1 Tax=Pogonomyrmex barbatus TaxID=144034 RepID=A0A6I9VXT9_9HYME|nr:uncharacterized protein LOC105422891 [Pogonomyrmex barbatus]
MLVTRYGAQVEQLSFTLHYPKLESLSTLRELFFGCSFNRCYTQLRRLRRLKITLKIIIADINYKHTSEILTDCFNNIGRNNNTRTNKIQCDGNRNNNFIIHDMKYIIRGKHESPRKSLDFFKCKINIRTLSIRRFNDIRNLCYKRHKIQIYKKLENNKKKYGNN